jgi:hypothetical protein
MVESDHEVVMRSLRAAGDSCAALQLALSRNIVAAAL